MTLEDLKKRATAAEITLIETIEKMVSEEANSKALDRVKKFVAGNEPTIRSREDQESMRGWFHRLQDYLEAP